MGSEVIGLGLRAGVLPPDVQHEDRSDEEQTHHQHWYRATIIQKKKKKERQAD